MNMDSVSQVCVIHNDLACRKSFSQIYYYLLFFSNLYLIISSESGLKRKNYMELNMDLAYLHLQIEGVEPNSFLYQYFSSQFST